MTAAPLDAGEWGTPIDGGVVGVLVDGGGPSGGGDAAKVTYDAGTEQAPHA